MGIAAVKEFLQHVKLMKARMGYAKVVSWYVCRTGFTKEAAQLLAQSGCRPHGLTVRSSANAQNSINWLTCLAFLASQLKNCVVRSNDFRRKLANNQLIVLLEL